MLLNAATLVFAGVCQGAGRRDRHARRSQLIYAYYGDKKGLYRAVLASRVGEFADPVVSQTVAREAGPRRALEELIRRLFRTLIEDRPFARLLAWELLPTAAKDVK